MKAFSGMKITEVSSLQKHSIKMLSLMEKFENLQAGLENEMYIDVIFHSLIPSYGSFVVNFNMNGLSKSIHKLINILIQFETMTKKTKLIVMLAEVSKLKPRGKMAECGRRKKGMAKAAASALSRHVAEVAVGKEKGKGVQG
ncbi:UNVERIFIED_CONTAM: hypothetical protein Scaly_0989500 [Sesamum calycinum]|uniref:UBN2 domain-containing protein n=1 Tax=Sesamum calycinum TaxID=2727403 RepID=A0AAW2QZP7_9LAMI